MLRNALRPVIMNQAAASPIIFFTVRTLANKVKVSTGLVGLPVDPHARENLIKLYKQTLTDVDNLKLEIKQDVIAITKYRLGVVEKLQDPEEIEEEIKCGQIEELVQQAKDELNLLHWLIGNAQDNDMKKDKGKKKAMLGAA